MNKRLLSALAIAFVFAAFSADSLWAGAARLVYIEGEVTLEGSGGVQRSAEIGLDVSVGDTLYTAANSRADIELESGSTVIIGADSVFNVGETADTEAETRKKDFFRVLLGSVSFKFRKMTQEPDVGTPLTVCSVRGTDFTVYTTPDGTSMTVVSDGLVEVTSGRASTMLSAGQGVEAVVGLGLGEPFEAKHGYVRYENLVDEALARIDENPVGSLQAIADQMEAFIDEGIFYQTSWDTNHEEVNRVKPTVRDIRREQGDEEGDAAYAELLLPLINRGLELNATHRYNVNSALAIRRHILTGYYIRMRTKYLADSRNPEWIEFSGLYHDILALYETKLMPLLEEEDL